MRSVILGCLFLCAAFTAASAKDIDVSPGFKAGGGEEILRIGLRDGFWRGTGYWWDSEADDWVEAGPLAARIQYFLRRGYIMVDTDGIVLPDNAVGTDGQRRKRMRIFWSYDRVKDVYRIADTDSITGTLHMMEGQFGEDAVLRVTSIPSGVMRPTGPDGAGMHQMLEVSELASETYTMTRYVLPGSEVDENRDPTEQDWVPKSKIELNFVDD
jgi:hypothetical protein